MNLYVQKLLPKEIGVTIRRNTMKHLLWRSVLTVALTFWLLGTPSGAQQKAEKADPKAGTEKSASGTANPDVEEKALAVFNKMATFLSQAPKLSVTIESGYDAVQPSGRGQQTRRG
jgi:hypothetical protein